MLVSSEMTEINNDPCLLTVARDITEQKRTEQRMTYLANYDHLTGLPNRALFRDRLDSAMLRAQRSERLVGLLYLDLDRFPSRATSVPTYPGKWTRPLREKWDKGRAAQWFALPPRLFH